MQKEILVKFVNVYGEDKVYPVDEPARNFARIAGTKTLTEYTISLIKSLGYTVNVQHQHTATL